MANDRSCVRQFFTGLALALGCAVLGLSGTRGEASAETFSLPDNAVGAQGQTAEVFLDVTGATGFLAVDMDISFNPAVIVITGAAKGAVAPADCTLTTDIPAPPNPAQSVVKISLFCSTAVSSDGQLVRLDFDVVGAPGTTSPLTFAFCEFDETACTTDNGLLTVLTPFTVSGKVLYYNGLATRPPLAEERLVQGVNVRFSGQITDSDTTGADGSYLSPDIIAAAPAVTVQPRKRGDINNAITSFDASLVAQHVAGLITLNARQLIAAETSGNGVLTSFDASRIAQFRVGLLAEFKMADDCGTDFVFAPDPTVAPNQTTQLPNTDTDAGLGGTCVYGQTTYNPLSASAVDQDFIAILMGDVSGNWQPPAAPLAEAAAGAAKKVKPARLRVGKKVGKSGATVTVPINIARAQGVLGVDMVLQYDPDALTPLEVTQTALSQDMTLVTNLDDLGFVDIALFGLDELPNNGNLLEVTFAVIGQEGTQSPVELIEAMVNENPAHTRHGLVRIQ